MTKGGANNTDDSLSKLFDDIRQGSPTIPWEDLTACFEAPDPKSTVSTGSGSTNESAAFKRKEKLRKRSRAIKLTDAVEIDPFVVLLANADDATMDKLIVNPARKDKAKLDLHKSKAELERHVLLKLRSSGLLSSFFISEDHDLSWLLEVDSPEQHERIRSWQHDAVDGNFPLFSHTFWLWKALVLKGINSFFTLRMAYPIAFAAITYGMFAEAIWASQYGIDFENAYLQNHGLGISEYHHRLRVSSLRLLKAMASGRLGEFDDAEIEFELAENAANSAVAALRLESPDASTLDHERALVNIRRERLRGYCHAVLEALPPAVSEVKMALSSAAESVFVMLSKRGISREGLFMKIESFLQDCQDSRLELPINWDTVARCQLFFNGNSPQEFEGIDACIDFGLNLLSDERFEGTHESTVLTKDCLETTRILMYLVQGNRNEALLLYNSLNTNFAPAERRLTRKRWQAIRKLLSV